MPEQCDATPESPDGEMPEDCALLRQYAEEGNEGAFAELVRRRIGLVYSVALRQSRGDAHRAEDATQAVFADLVRKAPELSRRPALVGWLHRSAQLAAAGLVRAEYRRRLREQEAHTMENDSAPEGPPLDWERVRPVLDEVLNEIDASERDAILLRFFDKRAFAEIGAHLRLSENTARMRVERALDKLHAALARRGIRSSAAALGAALAGQAASATPAGLAAAVTGTALAHAATTSTAGWIAFMSITKTQIAVVAALALVGLVGIMGQARANAGLQRELADLQGQRTALDALRAENRQLAARASEVATLQQDDTAVTLAQLNRELAEARRAQAAARMQASGGPVPAPAPPTGGPAIPAAATISLPDADLNTVLQTYEVIMRTKIVRDPSIASLRAIFTVGPFSGSGEEIGVRLREALRQKGVVLEPAADGKTTVAKLAATP